MKIDRDKYDGVKFLVFGFLAALAGFLISFLGGYLNLKFISVIGFFIGVVGIFSATIGFGLINFSIVHPLFSKISVFFGGKKIDANYVYAKDTTQSSLKAGLTTVFIGILIIAILYFIFIHYFPGANWEWNLPHKVP